MLTFADLDDARRRQRMSLSVNIANDFLSHRFRVLIRLGDAEDSTYVVMHYLPDHFQLCLVQACTVEKVAEPLKALTHM